MILLSDGIQGGFPNMIYPYPVYTIALGTDADQSLLKNIANSSGGQFFYAPNDHDLQGIFNEIKGILNGEVEVVTMTGTLPPSFNRDNTPTNVEHPFLVDGAIGTLNVSLNWTNAQNNITFELQDPYGKIYNPGEAAVNPAVDYVGGATYAYL